MLHLCFGSSVWYIMLQFVLVCVSGTLCCSFVLVNMSVTLCCSFVLVRVSGTLCCSFGSCVWYIMLQFVLVCVSGTLCCSFVLINPKHVLSPFNATVSPKSTNFFDPEFVTLLRYSLFYFSLSSIFGTATLGDSVIHSWVFIGGLRGLGRTGKRWHYSVYS